jgi:hypothetical protein
MMHFVCILCFERLVGGLANPTRQSLRVSDHMHEVCVCTSSRSQRHWIHEKVATFVPASSFQQLYDINTHICCAAASNKKRQDSPRRISQRFKSVFQDVIGKRTFPISAADQAVGA